MTTTRDGKRDDTEADDAVVDVEPGASPTSFAGESAWRRLYYGETAIDFYGARWKALIASAVLVVVTVVSLFAQGLNLSLEFVGGLSWDVPAADLTVEEARGVLNDAGLNGDEARIQELTSQGEDRLKIQVEQQPETSWTLQSDDLTADDARKALNQADLDGDGATITEGTGDGGRTITVTIEDAPDQQGRNAARNALASAGGVDRQDVAVEGDQTFDEVQSALAEAAGVAPNDVSVSSVSASWGENVTRQAVKALIVFLVLVMIFIAIRFEPLMALAALVALFHDVLISVGAYSVFQFTVSPATVIAFLTILGYSLYDTIVVYDKIRENRARFAASEIGYADITNVSMNQVLMRSLNTSLSSVLPVLALLVMGSWLLGASTLREFALALLVGMITGAYSSIFIATPLLAMMRGGNGESGEHATGEDLRYLVLGGTPQVRRRTARQRRADRERTTTRGRGGSKSKSSKARSTASTTADDADASDAAASADSGAAAADDDTATAFDVADAQDGTETDETETASGERASGASAASVLNHPPRPRKKRRH